MVWALVADALPVYPLYALYFADTGLSGDQITLLFAVWSLTGVLAEVPTGALADRFPRRWALAAGALVQSLGFALWMVVPSFTGFAAGFVLWGLGGSLISGAQEALLYDDLVAVGSEDAYPAALGLVTAAGLVAQVPAALTATALFVVGGYELTGWVSVALCVATAWLALRLPEPRLSAPQQGDEDEPGYLDTLRLGVRAAFASRAVLAAVLALALVGGIDTVEEYFGLLAADWGVAVAAVPAAGLGIVVAGAAGAAYGGAGGRRALGPRACWLLLAVSGVLLGAAAAVRVPLGLVAVAVSYAAYRAVLVVVEARLQAAITDSGTRATVTSVAVLLMEASVFAVYAAWVLGGGVGIAVMVLVVAALLPRLLRHEDALRPRTLEADT